MHFAYIVVRITEYCGHDRFSTKKRVFKNIDSLLFFPNEQSTTPNIPVHIIIAAEAHISLNVQGL